MAGEKRSKNYWWWNNSKSKRNNKRYWLWSKGFSWKTADIDVLIHSQSSDIALGVDAKGNKDEGAGDQGIMFGYACRETEELMPAPIFYSHKILRLMAEDRKKGILKGIEPDSKSQITIMYENNLPKKVTSVVISTQHSEDLDQKKSVKLSHILKSIPENLVKDLKDNKYNNQLENLYWGPDGDSG